jgi:hypothetical protein
MSDAPETDAMPEHTCDPDGRMNFQCAGCRFDYWPLAIHEDCGRPWHDHMPHCPAPPRPETARSPCPVQNCHAGMLRDHNGRDSVSCPVCDGVLPVEAWRHLMATHVAAAPPAPPPETPPSPRPRSPSREERVT